MRKLIVAEFLTLDGVMEAPENWQFPHHSADAAEATKEQIHANEIMLVGRVTYDIFASSWPQMTNNEYGIADKLNSMPKYVVSTTLKKADWGDTTIISKNVVEEIRKLKQQDGGSIGVTGSATLIKTLQEADLVDEYQLMIYPVVVGTGMRLFSNGTKMRDFKLTKCQTFESGAAQMFYQPVR